MTLRINSIYIRNLLSIAIFSLFLVAADVSANAAAFHPLQNIGNWTLKAQYDNLALYEHNENNVRFSISYVDSSGYTAKQYALILEERYNGFGLKPLPSVRGWVFAYKSNIPCSLVVLSKNSNLFEVIELCGNVSDTEVSLLLNSIRMK